VRKAVKSGQYLNYIACDDVAGGLCLDHIFRFYFDQNVGSKLKLIEFAASADVI